MLSTVHPSRTIIVCALLGAALPATLRAEIIVSPAAFGDGSVRTFSNQGNFLNQMFPFGPEFRGGVRVATGDVNGDGGPDIICGAGDGSVSQVRVFDTATGRTLHDFFAYDPAFKGGVFVAAGDVNGDGRADVITGAGNGQGTPTQVGPRVRVFNPVNEQPIADFFSAAQGFTGGVPVAMGNMGLGGAKRIVTGVGPGALPIITEFSLEGIAHGSALAYPAAFTGGVRVATGDVNGDGVDDIVTGPGQGGGGLVKVFDGTNGQPIRSFFAFGSNFSGGVSVAAGDVNGDGVADIITGELPAVQLRGASNSSLVRVFDGATLQPLASFFAFDGGASGGVEVSFVAPAPGTAACALVVGGVGLRRRRR